jgi:hypothetical protein
MNFIEKIQDYKEKVKIVFNAQSERSSIDPGTFNIKTYMAMYPAIKIQNKNYLFDYYYYDIFTEGKPYIYVRNKKFNVVRHIYKKADKRNLQGRVREVFIRWKLSEFVADSCNKASNNVYPKETDEGYLQYLYFNNFGEIFALRWHADYNNKKVISNKQEIANLLQQYYEQKKDLDEINNTLMTIFVSCDTTELQHFLLSDSICSLQFNSDAVIIRWIELEDWGGVFERTYKIMRNNPYPIELINERRLMEITKNFIH